MSDWDVTNLGLSPRARAHLLGLHEATSVLGRELSLSDLDTRALKEVGSAFPQEQAMGFSLLMLLGQSLSKVTAPLTHTVF